MLESRTPIFRGLDVFAIGLRSAVTCRLGFVDSFLKPLTLSCMLQQIVCPQYALQQPLRLPASPRLSCPCCCPATDRAAPALARARRIQGAHRLCASKRLVPGLPGRARQAGRRECWDVYPSAVRAFTRLTGTPQTAPVFFRLCYNSSHPEFDPSFLPHPDSRPSF